MHVVYVLIIRQRSGHTLWFSYSTFDYAIKLVWMDCKDCSGFWCNMARCPEGCGKTRHIIVTSPAKQLGVVGACVRDCLVEHVRAARLVRGLSTLSARGSRQS